MPGRTVKFSRLLSNMSVWAKLRPEKWDIQLFKTHLKEEVSGDTGNAEDEARTWSDEVVGPVLRLQQVCHEDTVYCSIQMF